MDELRVMTKGKEWSLAANLSQPPLPTTAATLTDDDTFVRNIIIFLAIITVLIFIASVIRGVLDCEAAECDRRRRGAAFPPLIRTGPLDNNWVLLPSSNPWTLIAQLATPTPRFSTPLPPEAPPTPLSRPPPAYEMAIDIPHDPPHYEDCLRVSELTVKRRHTPGERDRAKGLIGSDMNQDTKITLVTISFIVTIIFCLRRCMRGCRKWIIDENCGNLPSNNANEVAINVPMETSPTPHPAFVVILQPPVRATPTSPPEVPLPSYQRAMEMRDQLPSYEDCVR